MKKWAPAALQDLVKKMDSDPNLRFKAGNLGSIWFDTPLTGKGVDGNPKEKMTRVCIVPHNTDDVWTIMLDATFDATW